MTDSARADDGGEAEKAKLEAKAADPAKAGDKLALKPEEGETDFVLKQDRSCTDMLCLVIFALFWVVMFAIAGAPMFSHWPTH